MKVVIPTGILLLLLGTNASTYARQGKGQEEHPQESKPAQQQSRPVQQQHAQQHAKPAQQEHAQQHAQPAQQQHAQQQSKPVQQQHAQQQARPEQQQHAQQRNAAQSQARPQQSHPAGGNGGRYGRISDSHYAASFGSGHRFHVSKSDYEHRRFQYGGYSFGFVDPWPVGWGYSDDVYVVYVDGGYYMYDPVHPGVRISINIF